MLHKGYWMVLGGVVLLLIGLAVTCMATDDLRHALHCRAEPEEVPAAELPGRPTEGNTYITLSAFTYHWDGILTFREEQGPNWNEVWIPITPAGTRAADRPRNVRAIVIFHRIPDNRELQRVVRETRWTGLVCSRGRCGYEEDLRRRMPGIDLNRCWVIWEGRKPPRLDVAAPLVGLGLCLFALGGGLFFRGGRSFAQLDEATRATMNTMMPITILLGVFCRWYARRQFPPQRVAFFLIGTGLLLLGLGSYLAVQSGGWYAPGMMSGAGMGGVLLCLFGFAFAANGLVNALLASHEPTKGEVAEPSVVAPPAAERAGPGGRRGPLETVTFGLGLAAPAGFLLVRGDASANLVAGMAGVGVTLSLLGGVWYWNTRRTETECAARFWD
jgi:hypothetical protein